MALPKLTDKEWARVDEIVEGLNCSIDEAISILREDKEIDRVQNIKDLPYDLPEERKAGEKKARQAERKAVRKPKPQQAEIVSAMLAGLDGMVTNVAIANPEREFYFERNGIRYKVVMSVPRK